MMNYFFKSKAYLVCFALFFLSNFSYGQKNLVPNYSFENYDSCPSYTYNPPPNPWFVNCQKSFVMGSAYVNACANTGFSAYGVPNNFLKGLWNYQLAHTGQAYVLSDYIDGIYDRGYIETKLLDSLRKGKRYYVEFFVNLPNVMNWACNNSGALLTKNPVFGDTTNFTCGFYFGGASVLGYGNPIILDTAGWTKIAGIYTAQGGEQYITIGNFYSKPNTKIVIANPSGVGECSYLIDDVSVILLDSFCLKADAGKDTTIALGDSVFIGSYTNGIDSLKWQIQNTTIDSTRPGFWVKPTVTTSYVLQQVVNGCFSADTVVVTVGTVPLKMINYKLLIINEPSLLRGTKQSVENFWTTANEVNVSHFNVQRSTNDKDFITIGKVAAQNKNSNEYRFYDSPPVEGLGVVYYRIESIDFDGKKQYSEIRTLNIKPQTLKGISIFPNPARTDVTVECKGAKELLMIDYLGKVVYRSTVSSRPLTINTKQFVKGIYVVKVVMNNGELKTEKLIVE